jgi:hypothetical protein
MKRDDFRYYVLVMAIAMFFISGCSTNGNLRFNPTGVKPVQFVVLEEGGYRWFVVISEVNYLPNNPPGAVVLVRNELDRSITVDFDGPSHYTVSIGDKKEQEITIQPGDYKLMASAPGLSFVPRDYKYSYRDRYVYRQVWQREKLETKY